MDAPSPNSPQVDVVGLGLNAADYVLRLPTFPQSDSKMEFLSAHWHLGGQTASAVIACQRWGLRTRYIGKAGDDDAAKLHEQEFARTGVEARLFRVPDCSSQTAFILVDETSGERTILWRRDARLALQPAEIRRDWVQSARLLLVDGHDTAASATAAQWAREKEIPVVADVDNIYSGLQVLLHSVDYLMSSRQFPSRFSGEQNILTSLRAIAGMFGCTVAGATLGSEGAVLWDGARFLYSPAYAVTVADTTGAGDIFHGAFAYGILQGWPLARVLDFSCAAAALNCTAPGARGRIATVEEIENLMMKGARRELAFEPEELAAAQT